MPDTCEGAVVQLSFHDSYWKRRLELSGAQRAPFTTPRLLYPPSQGNN